MANPRVVSKCTVFPNHKSNLTPLQLSVSDLPKLSCHYVQKGVLFPSTPFPILDLLSRLKFALSLTLTHFPPLAGRLITNSDGYVYIDCNDAGVDFIHADASNICITDLLGDCNRADVPEIFNCFFALNGIVGNEGHFRPNLGVQVTELADGVFIGCSMNHVVADGASFWNFFNSFAEFSRGMEKISVMPDFSRESALISSVVPKLPTGEPTGFVDPPVRDRIFSFSRKSILKLKAQVNGWKHETDASKNPTNPTVDISSFQSLSALLWLCITRARKLPPSKMTTFKIWVNCRNRMEPKLAEHYFGNAIQGAASNATAGDVLAKDLQWCANQLNKSVVGHDSAMVKKYVEDWERDPRCYPTWDPVGPVIVMGSSSRFPMYNNDFGWGQPVAIRSGKSCKFDGCIFAYPGKEGDGSIDLEVMLAPGTMAGLETDPEFMQYVG